MDNLKYTWHDNLLTTVGKYILFRSAYEVKTAPYNTQDVNSYRQFLLNLLLMLRRNLLDRIYFLNISLLVYYGFTEI